MSWGKSPNYGHEFPPCFDWPAERVGLSPEALFGELHQRFNTTHLFIQDMTAFHLDVTEIAQEADGPEDFYNRLELRRNKRVQELRQAMDELVSSGKFLSAFAPQPGQLFVQLAREASFDYLVRFFTALLDSPKRPPSPYRSPSPYIARPEDGMTQEHYDHIGNQPGHGGQWTWEDSVQRDERMMREGKIIQRQGSSRNPDSLRDKDETIPEPTTSRLSDTEGNTSKRRKHVPATKVKARTRIEAEEKQQAEMVNETKAHHGPQARNAARGKGKLRSPTIAALGRPQQQLGSEPALVAGPSSQESTNTPEAGKKRKREVAAQEELVSAPPKARRSARLAQSR